MEFRILGPTEVLDGGRRVPLPSGRGRALLALLALHAGEPVSADRLIDELWGEDPPPTARTVVHGLMSKLRRMLEPDRAKAHPGALLQTFGSGYQLTIEPDTVDAHRFKRLIDEAREAPVEVRSTRLSAALTLWRGPALADFTYEPFAQRAISALEELRIQAMEDRIEADLALGRAADLVPELEQLIGDHPFRERLRGSLMLALYRSGRQATPSRRTATPARCWSRSWASNPALRCVSSKRRSCGRTPCSRHRPTAPVLGPLAPRGPGCLASAARLPSPSSTSPPWRPRAWMPRRSGASAPRAHASRPRQSSGTVAASSASSGIP